MATVTFENATRTYPHASRPAVDGLDLTVQDGEFLVLVGPSGCGKSTSLRMLAGLEQVSHGRVYIGEREVTHTDPADRDIAMVFQNYALYPHMTVRDNMAFSLKIAGVSPDERTRRITEAAEMLEIGQVLDKRPRALSGGQRQRVAMGRAIVRKPQVFLMDEPLSNLDAQLRVRTRAQISLLTRRLGITTVYVTHDQTEAMTMGDRVAVLKDGRLHQVGTPRDLYERPVDEFVAGFIGSPAMNFLDLPVTEHGVDWGGHTLPVPRELLARAVGEIRVGVRPEHLVITTEGGLPLHVDNVEELGADSYIYGHLRHEDDRHLITVRTGGYSAPEPGTVVTVVPAVDALHLFDRNTGRRL